MVVEKVGSLYPSLAENIRLVPTYLRSTVVGFFLGIMPRFSVTSFMAYDLEKRISKHPERLGPVLKASQPRRGQTMPAQAAVSSCPWPSVSPFACSMVLLMLITYYLTRDKQQNPDVVWGLITVHVASATPCCWCSTCPWSGSGSLLEIPTPFSRRSSSSSPSLEPSACATTFRS